METTKYNALEELHNELNRGTPGDEVSLNIGGKEVLRVKFQTGGTATTEKSGVFIEDLLIVAYAKLNEYNKYLPSRENSLALTKIEEAIMWLANRKAEREARGVYGTEEK
jgi:hypothetical protein